MESPCSTVSPAAIGAPKPTSGSVLKDLLATLSTEVLIEECERRGLGVEATDA